MIAKLTILLALATAAYAGIAGYGYGLGGAAIAAPVAYRAAPVAVAAAPAIAKFAAPVLAAAPVLHAPQPYEFGYNRQHEDGALVHRHETSDGVNQQGSYGYTGPDGIYRRVNYIADAAGFRANIETNEPGTANQNPAAVGIAAAEPPYKVLPAAAPVAVAHAAPVLKAVAPVAAVHAAPVYRAAPVLRAAPAYAHAAFAAPAIVKGHGYY